jgi:hypothetical protein
VLEALPDKFEVWFDCLKVNSRSMGEEQRSLEDIELCVKFLVRLGENILLFDKIMTNSVIIDFLIKRVIGGLVECSFIVDFSKETWELVKNVKLFVGKNLDCYENI